MIFQTFTPYAHFDNFIKDFTPASNIPYNVSITLRNGVKGCTIICQQTNNTTDN